MSTAAVITRVQLIEAPYLNEFISWYLQLGFRKVYFINTEPQNLSAIKEFIDPKLLEKIHFTNYAGNVNSFGYARGLFTKTITEDYILHVDTDEFLVLPREYPTVQELVQLKKYDIYTFAWVTLPITELYRPEMLSYLYTPTAKFKASPARKMMVKRKSWLKDPRSQMSMHFFKCAGRNITFGGDAYYAGHQPFIIHFLVRGYLHTMLKIIAQRDIKQGGKNQLGGIFHGKLPIASYPMRLKIAIGECYSAKTTVPINNWNIPEIEYSKPSLIKNNNLIKNVLRSYSKEGVDYTTQDVLNLTHIFNNAIKVLNTKKCPTPNVAGGKYLTITSRYLK